MTRIQPVNKNDINRLLTGADKELRPLLRLAHEQGFRIGRTRSKHYSITTPEHWREQKKVFAPGTPSDVRGLHRVARKLRHLGVQIPHT